MPDVAQLQFDLKAKECELELADEHIKRMAEQFRKIADIAEGSRTLNSLPHIAKLARAFAEGRS